jgi:hypothetical protein
VLVKLNSQRNPHWIAIRVGETLEVVLLVELLEFVEGNSCNFHTAVLQNIKILEFGAPALLQDLFFTKI